MMSYRTVYTAGLTLLVATGVAFGQEPHMTDSELTNIDRLWDFDDATASEKRFRDLLEGAAPTEHPSAHAEILTQVARAQGLQRLFAEAHATLDAVERMSTEVSDDVRIRLLLERGRVHNSSGDAAQSTTFFQDALSLAQETGAEFYAVDAAHMLGIVTPPAEQVRWNLEAIRMAEAAEDPRAKKWLGSLYNNTGWSYVDSEDYPNALELLSKALEYFSEHGSTAQARIGEWSVAKVLRLLGRADEALKMQEALLAAWTSDDESDGYVYEELGECLLALDRPDEAKPYFGKAYEILSQDPWLKAEEPDRLNRLRDLGGVAPDESE